MKSKKQKKQNTKPASKNTMRDVVLSEDQYSPRAGLPVTPDPVTFTAIITATFSKTEPGDSKVTATHGATSKTIDKTETIKFDNVQSGEMIMIQGKSLGSSDFAIDVDASPVSKHLDPGKINFNFIIL